VVSGSFYHKIENLHSPTKYLSAAMDAEEHGSICTCTDVSPFLTSIFPANPNINKSH
jgi:hypothetical protein